MDGGLSDDEQFQFQASRTIQDLMVRVGLKDLLREKRDHDEMLKRRDFKNLKAYVLTLDKTPDVVTSSFLSPTKDFNDIELQDLSEITVPVHGVGFNLLSTQSGGVAVLTWLKTPENIGRKLAESLHGLDINDQPDALIRFAFSQTDNTHFSKSWWNQLSERQKSGIRRLIAQDIHMHAEPTSLIDNGLRVATFKVTHQQWL